MSEMEYHSGKGKLFPRKEKETLAAYIKRFAEYKNKTIDPVRFEDVDEWELADLFGDTFHTNRYKYEAVLVNGTIWELIGHERAYEVPEICEFKRKGDTINFKFYFYNGGGCFAEVLEGCLKKGNE
jgi:hypothetical protein